MSLDKEMLNDDTHDNAIREIHKRKKPGEYFDDEYTRYVFRIHPKIKELIQEMWKQNGKRKGYQRDVFNEAMATYLVDFDTEKLQTYRGLFDIAKTYPVTTFYIHNELLEKLNAKLLPYFKIQGNKKGIKADVMMDVMLLLVMKEADKLGEHFIQTFEVRELINEINSIPRGRAE